MTDDRVLMLEAKLNCLLGEAAALFNDGAKVTLLIRNDVGPGKDADIVMTNDTLPQAIAALEHRLHQQKGQQQ